MGVLSCFLLKELGFVLEIAASLARDTPAFRRPQKVGWRTDDSQTVVVCATVRLAVDVVSISTKNSSYVGIVPR